LQRSATSQRFWPVGAQSGIETLLQEWQLLDAELVIEITANGLAIGRAGQVSANRLDGSAVGGHPDQHLIEGSGGAGGTKSFQRQMRFQGLLGAVQDFRIIEFGSILAVRMIVGLSFSEVHNKTTERDKPLFCQALLSNFGSTENSSDRGWGRVDRSDRGDDV